MFYWKARLILFTILCFFISILSSKAQDPVFSQFYASPMHINPALAGVSESPLIAVSYRNQWPNAGNAFHTYAASYGQYVPKLQSGFGLAAFADIAGQGTYNTYKVGVFYAYDVRFSDKFYVRLGLNGDFVSKRLGWDKLIFLDQIDPQTGIYNSNGQLNMTDETQPAFNVSYFDLGVGTVINTPYFYAGLAIKHLTTPREGFMRIGNTWGELPLQFVFHAGSEISLQRNNKYKKTTFLSPSLLFVKQQNFYQLNVGTYLRYKSILSGIWFRHTFTNSDAVILMAGFQKGVLRMTYSFDWTVSRLGINAGGAHEISLVLNLENKSKKKQLRYNDCLQIFR